MTRFFQSRVLFTGLASVGVALSTAAETRTGRQRAFNVLMIIIDDVAANLHSVDGPGRLRTPNLERLASRGTWFANAYNDAPVCAGSRTALLTGVHAARSGAYYNTQAYRRSGTWIASVQSLPASFLRSGYLTAGYGKISHNRYLEDDISDYTPGYYKMFGRGGDITHGDEALLKYIVAGSRREIPGTTSRNWTWGILPDDWERTQPDKLQQDTEQANRTIALLQAKHTQPFFLACGFWRPHVRWTVPQRYYDRFPPASIALPAGYRIDDLEDLPKPGRWIATHRGEHAEVVAGRMWQESIRGYGASMAYIDEQIGRILDALERSDYREDTIVVFFSDNGMHLGEKDHWLKYALWEQTCRVFLSVAVPGFPRQRSTTPVSLIDLYPTLLRLCGTARPSHELDGVDLTPILRGESTDRGRPVLSTYGEGNHAIRNDRFRYIRYRNGDEELYDHSRDPYEWANLAADPRWREVKRELANWLPQTDAPGIREEDFADDSRWTDEAFK